jgi:hypothetical protein
VQNNKNRSTDVECINLEDGLHGALLFIFLINILKFKKILENNLDVVMTYSFIKKSNAKYIPLPV